MMRAFRSYGSRATTLMNIEVLGLGFVVGLLHSMEHTGHPNRFAKKPTGLPDMGRSCRVVRCAHACQSEGRRCEGFSATYIFRDKSSGVQKRSGFARELLKPVAHDLELDEPAYVSLNEEVCSVCVSFANLEHRVGLAKACGFHEFSFF